MSSNPDNLLFTETKFESYSMYQGISKVYTVHVLYIHVPVYNYHNFDS